MRKRRMRPRGFLTAAAAVAVLAGCGIAVHDASPHAGHGAGDGRGAAKTAPRVPKAPAVVQIPASDGLPAVQYSPASPPPAWSGPVPYPILIADRGNNRMMVVSPNKQVLWAYPPAGGLPPGQNFGSDDDAFFTPDGSAVITNEEHDGTITAVSFYTAKPVWSFGTFGKDAYGQRLVNWPDDAYRLPDGTTIVADIRNCRELFINLQGQITQEWGKRQTGYCKTDPEHGYLGYPNGDTPQPNGDILLSLINGNRIVLMSPAGQVIWDVQAPDIGAHGGYVSDPQLLPDGDVLVADYNGLTQGGLHHQPHPGGAPGKVVIFNPHTLQVDWLYDATSGDGVLDHPSLAEALPNGDVILCDDYNDRVMVIDRVTKRIVWQYGVTGKAGTAPGYLDTPDGFALDYFRNWQAWLQQEGTNFKVGPFVGQPPVTQASAG